MTLSVRETGPVDAPTIVLLHGAGVSSWMWQPQLEALHDYHCLAPDLPGHGQSAANPFTSREDVADQVASLIREKAHGGRAHLAGLSLGGQIVIELLLRAPELIDHALASGVLARSMGAITTRLLGPMTKLSWPLANLDWMVRASARQAGIPEVYIPQMKADTAAMTASALTHITLESLKLRPRPEMSQIRIPTLILVGEQEPKIQRASARDLVAAIPTAKAYLIKGVGHTWNLQDPARFNATVRAWISGQALPAGLKLLQ